MNNVHDLLPLFDRLVYEVHQLVRCQHALDNTNRLSYEWDRKNLEVAYSNYDSTVQEIRDIFKEYRL